MKIKNLFLTFIFLASALAVTQPQAKTTLEESYSFLSKSNTKEALTARKQFLAQFKGKKIIIDTTGFARHLKKDENFQGTNISIIFLNFSEITAMEFTFNSLILYDEQSNYICSFEHDGSIKKHVFAHIYTKLPKILKAFDLPIQDR